MPEAPPDFHIWYDADNECWCWRCYCCGKHGEMLVGKSLHDTKQYGQTYHNHAGRERGKEKEKEA